MINELGPNDWRFKAIKQEFEKGREQEVGQVVCNNPNAKWMQVEERLLDASYADMVEFADELQVEASAEDKAVQETSRMQKLAGVVSEDSDLSDEFYENEEVDQSAKRMREIAGIAANESNLGAAYAERELDGDASRQMHEEVDFLDLKDGQDVFVKSKKAYAVITDLAGPSSPDTGEDPHIVVKLRNGEEIEVPITDIEVDNEPDSGNGEHYGDEEDDLNYYASRGWKSRMEEFKLPEEKPKDDDSVRVQDFDGDLDDYVAKLVAQMKGK